MTKRNVQFKIYRYDPDKDEKPYMQDITVELEPSDKKLLDALVRLRAKDDSMSFRRSCREGVCGSDAMNINGKNGLACLTDVDGLQQPITLGHPKFPANSSYAITKTANEDFLEISGLDFVTFRLANVVGPRNVSGPLPIFYQRLAEGKRCFVTKARRDFVFVKDLARSVLRACDGVGHGTYHFSSGGDISILELYDAVVKAMDLRGLVLKEIV